MTFYISGDEVVACALVLKMRGEHTNIVSLEEARSIAQTMRNNFIKHKVDAIVTDYQLEHAVYNNPGWFEFINIGSTPCIKCKDNRTANELEGRFLCYVPISLLHYAME